MIPRRPQRRPWPTWQSAKARRSIWGRPRAGPFFASVVGCRIQGDGILVTASGRTSGRGAQCTPMTRSRKMIGRTLAIAALVGSAGLEVVPLTHAEPIAVFPELLQQASIITPEGVMVDPNNKEELKKYDNRHDLSELADTLRKEFGVTKSHLTQLIACTGPVVCRVPSADGKRINTYQGSGSIALQPNVLVTVKHRFQNVGPGAVFAVDS